MARIIIADDDPIIGELVSNALIDAGHGVGWVADGATALAVMRRRPPNLAIIDCAMPGLAGIQLLRQMRVEPGLCQVPVLMLTARSGERDEAIAYGAGADDYLTKPVDLDQLVGRVSAILLRPRQVFAATG